MEHLYREHPDKLKAIGVSNVSVEFLEKLLTETTVIPAVNQIELHPLVLYLFHDTEEVPDAQLLVLTYKMNWFSSAETRA